MDRDVQSRKQKSGAASRAASRPRQSPPQRPRQAVPPKRGLSSRVGLEKKSNFTPPSSAGQPRRNDSRPDPRRTSQGKPSRGQPQAGQQTYRRQSAPRRPQQGNGHRYRSTNPQSPGYRQGAARPPRRVTQVEKMRIRRRRKIVGILCLLAVLAVGVVLSVNLLFKVTEFRVENTDRSTPANTGIYSEQQIIDLLGIQIGDNLFGFSTKEKSRELQSQLPYLDVAEVDIQMPGTVVVKVQPATERFTMEGAGGWLVLSDGLKVLRSADSQPDGLILLDAAVRSDSQTMPGAYLRLSDDGTSLPAATPETAETAQPDTDGTSSGESSGEATDEVTTNDVLFEIVDKLEEQKLLDGVTMISMRDPDEINFLYQGRVSVLLGTSNNLDYKMRMAANVILDVDGKGLTQTDRGTLDVSYQRSDGDIVAYFLPADPVPTPAPEAGDSGDPASTGDGTDSGDTSDGDTDTADSDNTTDTVDG